MLYKYEPFFKDQVEIERYVDSLSYEEWKELLFTALNDGMITQRNLMRALERHRDNDYIFEQAFRLSQALHALPSNLLSIATASDFVELEEVFGVGRTFIQSTQSYLIETIHCMALLQIEAGHELLIMFNVDRMIGLTNYLEEWEAERLRLVNEKGEVG